MAARITPGHVAAAVAQAGSYATTYAFFSAIGLEGLNCVLISLIAEALLTKAKTFVIGKKAKGDAFGWIALGLDTIFNAGGLWTFILNLDKTPSWRMLVESLGMAPDMQRLPALVIALAAGFFLAIAPHKFWNG